MRSGIEYALVVVAALLAVVGVLFIVAAGGNEPEPIRASGLYLVALAAAVGIGVTVVLRSR